VTKGSCVWPAADIPASAHRTRGSGLLLQPEITNKVKGRGEIYKTGDWRRHTVHLVSGDLTNRQPATQFTCSLGDFQETQAVFYNISVINQDFSNCI
jgi:hypothetical protein